MQFPKRLPALSVWLHKSPRLLCIIGFVCFYVFGFVINTPQAFAATGMSAPGGRVSDAVVRQVDIARPAVVRIITKLGGRLTVTFAPTAQVVTFPLGGGSYPLELSGSGAFISAHGDILTADHVVNPPHDQGIDDALYQLAASDIANYVNTHLRPSQPFTSDMVVAELQAGNFPSTSAYDTPTSEVYLSTSYLGAIKATKFKEIPASNQAAVDRIEAQSAFDAMDVAIIHVSGMDDMPSIQLDDSSQVAEQDNLTVIGFPGMGDVSNSPTNLLTSSVNKLYVSAIKTTDANAPLIQVGGNVEHGDSGGPALDDSGHIVGIVSFGLVNPGESGQTTFLQAANSARTLIQSLHIDTTPGSFQQAWAQAFNDYASSAQGHWHKAFQELQVLANSRPAFQGINSYLTYAQNQTATEQLPVTSTGPNPVLVIVGVLLVLVILLGGVFFVVTKRRPQTVPAAAPYTPYGTYPSQQGGMSGAYAPTPVSYSSGTYSPVPGSTSGTSYPPVPASYSSGTYPPTPASYSGAAWYEQSTSAIPQTPQPSALPQVPVTPMEITSPPVQTPPLVNEDVATQAARPSVPYEHSLPSWAPVPQTPRPVSAPLSVSQDPITTSSVPSVFESVATPFVPAAFESVVTPSVPPAFDFAVPFMDSIGQPKSVTQDEVATVVEDQQPVLASRPASEASQDEDKTILAQPAASPRSFSVPRRPAAPVALSAEEPASVSADMYTWIAPCGHPNQPNVRFCRMCGQPAQAVSTNS